MKAGSRTSLLTLRLASVAAALVIITGCGGGEPNLVAPPPPPPPSAAGALSVAVAGLPGGVAAVVQVSGPTGFLSSVPSTQTLSGLNPGQYTVAASSLLIAGATWSPTPPSQSVTVASGTTATAAVTYGLSTGSLSVAVTGLPLGASGNVTVSGPGGFQASLIASMTLNGLTPGSYTISAGTVLFEGDGYAPTPATQEIGVVAGVVPAEAAVSHALATGRLGIALAGIPVGGTPTVTVTGPGGFSAEVTSSTVLTALAPGSYTVSAASIVAGGITYAPVPASQNVTVPLSQTPIQVSVSWAAASGTLSLISAGLPTEVNAAITVTGPAGYLRQVTGTSSIIGLPPGTYTITATTVASSGISWTPTPATQAVSIVVGGTASAGVAWTAVPGALAVTVSGLPPGVEAALRLSGPSAQDQLLTGSQTVSGLPPGSYTLTAQVVEGGGFVYAPTPATQALVIGSSTTPATVTYASTTSVLTVTINGLPSALAAVTVTGPGGFNQVLTQTTALAGLQAGTYQVAANGVTIGGSTWTAAPASQQVSVTNGVPANATVTYTATTGAMNVTVSGLPAGANASLSLSGPGGSIIPLTGSQLVPALAPGAWTVTASTVFFGGDQYIPTPVSQPVTVVAGAAAAVGVAYAIPAPTFLNLRIHTAYLTQAIQRPDHGVELVAGRDAYLRVFPVANQINDAQPQVRVRLFQGASEVATWLLNAPTSSVPQSLNESSLGTSWNVPVPGALVQPGLSLLAEVDPGDLIPETSAADNKYPESGVPLPLTVRQLLPFRIRLVPVMQTATGNTGNINEGNKQAFLSDLLKLMPIAEYDVDVRETYTTNAPALESTNANGAWSTILGEVLALRNTTDQSDRYYYGVVRVDYSSGIAGIGYVGTPTGAAKAAIGWDKASGPGVLAHELVHNFGRYHAPCGNPSGVDQDYPHANGRIGFWGLDLTNLSLKSPFTWNDLMGYCNNDWTSDYTWNAVMNFRSLSPTGAPPMMAAWSGADDGLLVWGRIGSSGTVLEPAFRVPSAGRPLPANGPYRVEGRDASGALLFSHPFDAAEVADLPGGPERHFAFVLPVGTTADRLAELRVSGPGIAAAERRAPPGAPRPSRDPQATRATAVLRRLTWDPAAHPMAMVRNAATGEILSFARGGEILLRTTATTLDIQLSDGVRVERRRVVVQ
ncbi:MAG: hypothetical protein ABR602_10890 [Gemmatimonadales bacterium]